MPPLPPFDLVKPVLLYDLGLPALAAAAVFFLALYFLPKSFGADLGMVLGIIVAFGLGNHFQHAVDIQLDAESPLTPKAWWTALKASIVEPTEHMAGPPPARYWLPWAVGAALLLGLAVRPAKAPFDLAMFVRLLMCGAAAYLLIPRAMRNEFAWLWPVGMVGMTLIWHSLDRLGTSSPGGWLPAIAAVQFLLAAGIVLHAHSARFADAAIISAGALIGVAVVSWWAKADSSAFAPLAAIGLPALMLAGYRDTFSEVPIWSFLLAAVSPLGLLPMLLVRSDRRAGWLFLLLSWLLALAPAILGLVLAMQAESLSFE